MPVISDNFNETQSGLAGYNEERNYLTRILPNDGVVRISHIGSTAVDTIWAKPIIDILIEAADEHRFSESRTVIESSGYICMSESEHRVSFNKGYTTDGFAEKVFHLHLRYAGDNDELYFRDYLIEHSEIAKEYENMKLGLWEKFEHNRDAYTDSKTDFIRKHTKSERIILRQIQRRTYTMNDWFTIEHIDRDTHIISEYRHWEETHAYLLNGTAHSLLIDTGLGIMNIHDEVMKLTDKPVIAVATHIHWDHIGGHKYFPEFYVHEDEVNWLTGEFPLTMEQIKAFVVEKCELPEGFNVDDYEFFQGTAAKVLKDNDVIDIGGRTLRDIRPGICAFGKRIAAISLPAPYALLGWVGY